MINFSNISRSSFIGALLRKLLSCLPKGFIMPVLQGPMKGMRWIVGSQTHGMWLGSYEIDKQLAIKNHLKPGQVFYDVGANVGYYSLLASKYVEASGSVVAFEPLPQNLEYLSSHARLNKLSNLTIIPMALSDHSGKDKFSYKEDASSCHITPEGNIEVSVTTLDKLLKEEPILLPNIIKVDIEGAEIDFLKGAIDTLIVHRPLIFMAIHSPQLFVLLFKTIAEYKLPYTIRNLNGIVVSDYEYLDEVILMPLKK
ncbi:MAG: FkbM family methyltransferase [Planctomycetota bacterium]